jgi:type II secretory pathway pseudopilin PulG
MPQSTAGSSPPTVQWIVFVAFNARDPYRTDSSLTGSEAKYHPPAVASFDTTGGIDAMRRHEAFTITELLVVIAVISTLTAMLMPVLSQARKKGHQTVCVSNMRQISLASAAYTQDYDECLVPAGSRYAHQPMLCYECGNNPACMTSPYWSSPYAWVDWGPALLPYIKNEQIFKDPDRPDWGCWGYAMNTDSSDDDFPGPPSAPGAFVEGGVPSVHLAQVMAPAECLFFFDSFDYALEVSPSTDLKHSEGPDTEAWETMNAWVQAARSGMRVQEAAEAVGITSPWRHRSGLVVNWLDGHVSWRRFETLTQRNLNIQYRDYDVLE